MKKPVNLNTHECCTSSAVYLCNMHGKTSVGDFQHYLDKTLDLDICYTTIADAVLNLICHIVEVIVMYYVLLCLTTFEYSYLALHSIPLDLHFALDCIPFDMPHVWTCRHVSIFCLNSPIKYV